MKLNYWITLIFGIKNTLDNFAFIKYELKSRTLTTPNEKDVVMCGNWTE